MITKFIVSLDRVTTNSATEAMLYGECLTAGTGGLEARGLGTKHRRKMIYAGGNFGLVGEELRPN